MDLIIERLDKSRHNRDAFSCGKEDLDVFIKQHANQNQKLGISNVYVAVLPDDNAPKKIIYGYYTLSSGQIHYEDLPQQQKIKLPKYPIPIVRIGKLAVDINYQKKGIGAFLLFDAFANILKSAEAAACYAVVVDAKDEAAKLFYQQYGFVELQHSGLTLFLPLQTIDLVDRA